MTATFQRLAQCNKCCSCTLCLLVVTALMCHLQDRFNNSAIQAVSGTEMQSVRNGSALRLVDVSDSYSVAAYNSGGQAAGSSTSSSATTEFGYQLTGYPVDSPGGQIVLLLSQECLGIWQLANLLSFTLVFPAACADATPIGGLNASSASPSITDDVPVVSRAWPKPPLCSACSPLCSKLLTPWL